MRRFALRHTRRALSSLKQFVTRRIAPVRDVALEYLHPHWQQYQQSSLHLALLRRWIAFHTRHVAGRRFIRTAPDELVVVCLARNGELYVRSFLEHYFSLGAKHIVLLLNRTTDRTAELARGDPRVTILACDLPFKDYQLRMRDYLARRFCGNRWALCVDIDEHFSYPYADRLALADLLRYLNTQRYTAVVAQMLDMFSEQSLGAHTSQPEDRLRDIYQYYDTSTLWTAAYDQRFQAANLVSNSAIRVHYGGIRKQVFGLDVMLTKHPLFRVTRGIELFNGTSHDLRAARLADFSCVLLHYKFLSNLPQLAVEAVNEGQYWQASFEYHKYNWFLEREPDMVIHRPSSQRLEHVNDLIDQNLLVVSPQYQRWAEQHRQHSNPDRSA